MFDIYFEKNLEQESVNKIKECKKENVVETLNKVYNNDWTYSIDEIIKSDKSLGCSVIITLAIPGLVRSGVGFGVDTEQAAYDALFNTIGTLSEVKENPYEGIKPQEQVIIPKENPVEDKTDKEPEEKPKKKINPKIQKAMDRFNISEKVALDYAKVCKDYNIDSKAKLLKYLQAWDNKIKDTKELKGENIKDFCNWIIQEKPFTE
jgi:hypothetical protein